MLNDSVLGAVQAVVASSAGEAEGLYASQVSHVTEDPHIPDGGEHMQACGDHHFLRRTTTLCLYPSAERLKEDPQRCCSASTRLDSQVTEPCEERRKYPASDLRDCAVTVKRVHVTAPAKPGNGGHGGRTHEPPHRTEEHAHNIRRLVDTSPAPAQT